MNILETIPTNILQNGDRLQNSQLYTKPNTKTPVNKTYMMMLREPAQATGCA